MILPLHLPLWNTSCCLPSKLPYSKDPPVGVSITNDFVVALKAPTMVVLPTTCRGTVGLVVHIPTLPPDGFIHELPSVITLNASVPSGAYNDI